MPSYFETGFSVREPMWHGMGVVLEDYPGNWSEARKHAGMEWEPVEEPQFRRGELVGIEGDGKPIYGPAEEVPGYKYIVRSDNRLILDSANSTYEVITHAEMGQIVEEILEKNDHVKYETAGVLQEGRRVWALARLGGEVEIKGDFSPIQPYLALLNSHDGTAALRVISTSVRIVCANTWHAAEVDSEHKGTAFSFKHTRNWRSQVEKAKDAVLAATNQVDAFVETARELLSRKYDEAMQREFVKRMAIERVIINSSKITHKNVMTHLSDSRVQRSMVETTQILNKLMDSRTNAELEPTAYKMAQVTGEFADHLRAYNSNDTYFTRTMIDIEPLKKAAVRIARELAPV